MVVGVALFEIHIPHAGSLKEKRSVVRSLIERVRSRFPVSVSEVGFQDLHQRARVGVTFVSSDQKVVEKTLASIQEFAESSVEGELLGWTEELLHFDEAAPLDLPHLR